MCILWARKDRRQGPSIDKADISRNGKLCLFHIGQARTNIDSSSVDKPRLSSCRISSASHRHFGGTLPPHPLTRKMIEDYGPKEENVMKCLPNAQLHDIKRRRIPMISNYNHEVFIASFTEDELCVGLQGPQSLQALLSHQFT